MWYVLLLMPKQHTLFISEALFQMNGSGSNFERLLPFLDRKDHF